MTLYEFIERFCGKRKRALTYFARNTPPCVTEKHCPKCDSTKSLTEFTRHAGHPDGYGSVCTECRTAHRRTHHAEKERKQRMRQYYANYEVELNRMRDYQAGNREMCRAACRKWRAEHPDRQAAAAKAWDSRNGALRRMYTRNRHAAKLRRTPPWLNSDQKRAIEDFYHLADALSRAAEVPFEVDHIVPLQGKNVSGLHVPWNLQVLTLSENCSKGNRYDVE